MKSKIILAIFFGAILTVNLTFSQQKKAEEIFKDLKTADEVLNYIVSNHELMMKFLDKVMANEHARDMVMEHLMDYAEKDTAMAENMCEMMMGSKNMMKMMKRMMEKKEMNKGEHKHEEHMH